MLHLVHFLVAQVAETTTTLVVTTTTVAASGGGNGGLEDFWVDLVLRLGFPVVVVLMLVKGWLVPGFIYDRVVKENDRLTTVFEEKALPALIKSNEVLERALPIIESIVDPEPSPRRRRAAGMS